MSRVTLTLDTALATALRDEAKADDRPMSSIARKAFTLYFESKKNSTPARPSPKTKGARQ